MTNPLMRSSTLPPFDDVDASHIEPAIDHLLARNLEQIESLLTQDSPTWDSFIAVIENLEDELSQATSTASHLNAVVSSPELREAWNNCRPKISEYYTALGQHPGLFAAYQRLVESPAYNDLDKPQRKAIDNALRDFRLAGIDLPAAEQARFAAIQSRLAKLSGQFTDNVLDATMAWKKSITDAAELSGLPASSLAATKQAAEEEGKEGYLLTLAMPCYIAVMTYCENADLRREMYEAYSTRASDQGPHAGQWDNAEIIRETLALRQEMSSLLGFSNYAERSLATKMADTPDQVMQFLNDLAGHSLPAAEREVQQLKDFAAANYGSDEVNAWDTAFYAEKLKQQQFSVSDEDTRPYFPAPKVISGMFEVVQRLYDLDITVTEDMSTWHADVTTYNIQRNGELIARFYFDLYARTGKRGGAWMAGCRTRRRDVDGTLQLPACFMTCNFSGPTGDSPALLTHDEVVTLFHEFGHGLHHMLTSMECSDVAGTHGVAWDAVELPSQFMENWCWEKDALAIISGHFETGEPLPEELLEKMLAARNFNSALTMARQAELSLIDFCLHSAVDASEEGRVQEIVDEVRSRITLIKTPDFNRFQNAFSHIFAGGYAAGYYSYKWAEVLSADAFSRFKQDGIFNRQTGEKFLASILEKGGSEDAMTLFIEFMGREPDIKALLRQEGIAEAA